MYSNVCDICSDIIDQKGQYLVNDIAQTWPCEHIWAMMPATILSPLVHGQGSVQVNEWAG